jgi:predicted DNA-binding transcriptional regulator AlpA
MTGSRSKTVRIMEIADILGVSHQRASKIVAERGFPKPVGHEGQSRVWDRREVTAWAKAWRRKKPWRRRTPAPSATVPAGGRRSTRVRVTVGASQLTGICMNGEGLLHDSVEMPSFRDAPQLVLARILESESRACHEIFDRLGDEDLGRMRERRDARTRRDRDTSRLPVDDLAFAYVDACSDLDTEVTNTLRYLKSAPDGSSGAVEGGVEPVAGGVVLDAPPPV